MPRVTLYTTQTCPYCIRARRLLERKGVVYEEIDINDDPAQRAVMIERSGRHTVPQIFIGERHIGGYDDMAELDVCGDLDPLLAA
ncbi:glutaredoxin 3 [Marichromatium gracile]|uniref:Glutaredoxin n=1 Tax=Marichromatium gracile TaxID=1048 RepID=A0A4R4A9M4_MARGR|nr:MULTISPECIES: glutaredoxin 3 [Marichromatium]MBO8085040.1 glutaredoxin 3 [Marichromatium sp.]MBK1708483.1 glutaredoxin 3 [Marichromatium gracile]MCF1184899.1 glutaredoxin 3 [Marichromatium gracile]RNE89964.1 glutaredoxin 3 [Marichromatium sp. AB31]RNE94159.1 glutaredoxin 3 [Marichromatium sp. AB32]